MTTQERRAKRKAAIGEKRKIGRWAWFGRIVSLAKSLRPSAKGWRRPKGPTTLGPLRNCIEPRIFLSRRVRKAMATKRGRISERDLKRNSKIIQNMNDYWII